MHDAYKWDTVGKGNKQEGSCRYVIQSSIFFWQAHKYKAFSTVLLPQMTQTWCVQQGETAHAASTSRHLLLTSRRWGTIWLKSRKSSPSYRRYLVRHDFGTEQRGICWTTFYRCWCKIFVCDAAYMGFMWMLLLVAYGQRDPNAYFLTQHIRQSFSKDISDSMSIQDVFNWANTTLLSNLFGEYPGQYAV